MLKQKWIAECDICGKQEEAKTTFDSHNEEIHVLPNGWKCANNKNVHLCPDCYILMSESGRVNKA